MAFEENEISKNSQGGTEITKRSIAKLVPEKLSNEFQVIPSRVRELEEDKIRIYWAHDLPEDPECAKLRDPEFRNKFHKFVFSSNWQLQQFVEKLGMPQDDKMVVVETPVEPLNLVEKPTETINLIYFSTPHRGLEILVPVFEALAEQNKDVRLDVFSSFSIYGWPDADKPFEPLYARIRSHPQMNYHGFAEQLQLRAAVERSHILAYPNTWKETSCRVLIESMSAGLLCVHPNLAALPDTSGGLTNMYQYIDNVDTHANAFYQNLKHAVSIANLPEVKNYTKFVKAYADTRFGLEKISSHWVSIMEELLTKYPTVESRKFPAKVFEYKS